MKLSGKMFIFIVLYLITMAAVDWTMLLPILVGMVFMGVYIVAYYMDNPNEAKRLFDDKEVDIYLSIVLQAIIDKRLTPEQVNSTKALFPEPEFKHIFDTIDTYLNQPTTDK